MTLTHSSFFLEPVRVCGITQTWDTQFLGISFIAIIKVKNSCTGWVWTTDPISFWLEKVAFWTSYSRIPPGQGAEFNFLFLKNIPRGMGTIFFFLNLAPSQKQCQKVQDTRTVYRSDSEFTSTVSEEIQWTSVKQAIFEFDVERSNCKSQKGAGKQEIWRMYQSHCPCSTAFWAVRAVCTWLRWRLAWERR